MIEFENSGAASPDTLEGQTRVDVFDHFGPASGLTPPPAPQMPMIGADGTELDFSAFEGSEEVAKLFNVPPPPRSAQADGDDEGRAAAVQHLGYTPAPATAPEAGEATVPPAAPSQKPPTDQAQAAPPATPEADEVLNKLKDEERKVVEAFRSGTLQKELTMIRAFEKNPVQFVEQYVPELKAQVQHRAATEVMSASEYAMQYAEAQLEQTYGEDFEYDPSELAIKGSESARYFADKQALMMQGMQQYNEIKAQKAQETLEKERNVEQAAKEVLVRHGVPIEHYNEVIRIAESLPATPETYYDMLFTYLRARGLVKGTSQAQPQAQVPAQQTQHTMTRPGQNLPPATTTSGRMTQQVASDAVKDLNEMFGGII
jgi:hypothetical protein